MRKSLEPPTSPSDAGALLAETERMRTRTRRDRHGYWLPLTLFGLIVLGAMPLFVESADAPPQGEMVQFDPSGILGGIFTANAALIAIYWLVALPLGYLATALYYRLRARRRGVGGRAWPYVATGIGLLAVLVFTAVPLFLPLVFLSLRGLAALLTVAVGLFVLASLERSRVLAGVATAFAVLAVAVNLYNFENVVHRLGVGLPYEASGIVNVGLAGAFLLGCGLVAARFQLARR
jgi:hypothetical protein